MSRTTTTLLAGLRFGEGPRWRDGRLWFSDMHDHQVLTVDEQGRSETVVEVPGRPSGLGWRPDGTLLVVSMTDRKLMEHAAGGLREVADLSALAPFHCNDMVVDDAGGAYVGNFGFDLDAGQSPCGTTLVRVTPDGSTQVAADELMFPNGAVITPDGSSLIVAETFGRRLSAFDIAADGSLGNRRVWAEVDKVFPDGICLDADGAVWVANALGAEVLRVAEGGEILERISTSQLAFACMLGGDDGKTLFVCTAASASAEECQAQRSAKIETLRVDVARAGRP